MINRLFRSLFGLDLRREREGKVRVASSSTPLVLLFSFSSLLFSSLSLVCFPSLLLVCLLFLTMFTACCGVSVSQTPSLARIRHCSRGVRIICPQSGTADTNGNGFFISMSPNGNNNIVSSLPRSSKKKKKAYLWIERLQERLGRERCRRGCEHSRHSPRCASALRAGSADDLR